MLNAGVTGDVAVDFLVHGLVRIRLVDAPAHIQAQLTREFGTPEAEASGAPDLTFRFVDALTSVGEVKILGRRQAAFDDEHFYLMDTGGHRARIDFPDLGAPAEVLCERGVAKAPLLIPLLGLYLVTKGHVLLHASSFVYRGKGVLVTGWSKGGKTETLLPFMVSGAEYVSDEWTIVGGQPTGLHGISTTWVWDWHLRQLPTLWKRISPQDRRRLRSWRAFRRVYLAAPALGRLPGGLGSKLRKASTDGGWRVQGVGPLRPASLFGEHVRRDRVPLDRVFLPIVVDEGGTYVTPVKPGEIAARMVHSLAFERAAMTTAYQQFRFAFPERVNPLLENQRERELELLSDALADAEAYELRHPYPTRLHDLYEAASAYC